MAFLAKKKKQSPAPTVTVEFKREKGNNTNLNEAACATTSPPTTKPLPTTTTKQLKTTTTDHKPLTTTASPPSITSTSLPATSVLPKATLTLGPLVGGQTTTANIVDEWNSGFKMIFKFLIQEPVNEGWIIKIAFSKPALQLQIWRAEIVSVSSDKKMYYVRNMSFNKVLAKCTVLEINFIANKDVLGDAAPDAQITFYRNGSAVPTSDSTTCVTTTAPSTANPSSQTTTQPATGSQMTTASPVSSSSPPTTHIVTVSQTTTILPTTKPVTNAPTISPVTSSPSPYDYNKVLSASILFYEAQRSGKLPASNRIPWRDDSALSDRGDNREDLTGGWYDAGDYVKFGFPMASSVTVLAWGLLEFRDAYKAAGELNNALDSIKWATDYFIKAHTAKFEFYGQVCKKLTSPK
jgi:hypothetical protein